MPITLLEITLSMTTSAQSSQPTEEAAGEVEVIKDLEHRGFHGLDTLSLEELQALTERKRKQLQLEATENKARLENEIISIDQQIQDLGARKVALTRAECCSEIHGASGERRRPQGSTKSEKE
jgi:hypothetical protein